MSRRFGKGRVPGCRCEHNLTCGECLRNAPPWHVTPTTMAEQAACLSKNTVQKKPDRP